MLSKNIHILIVRTSSLIIDFNTYNCQETGLAAALVRLGYTVSFITPGSRSEHLQLPVLGNKSIDVYTVTFRKLNRNLCWYHNYFSLLKNINPDLIHIDSISMSMSLFTQLWAEVRHKKTIVIQGNYETTQKPVLKQLEQLFNVTVGKYLIKHSNGIGCKTNFAAEFIKKYYLAEIQLTRIGLDISKFANHSPINWRHRLNLENEKILLYVGVLEPRRNPLFLIRIISELPDNYHLIIVGSGTQEAEAKSFSKSIEVDNRCHFIGKLSQNDLPSLYQTADLFLLPSNYEIFGMVILESMYFGTPVVTTLTAGSDAIITSNIDGIIIDNLDVSVWIDAIKAIVEDEISLKLMSQSACNTIKEHLIWDKTVYEYVSLYNSALKTGG